VVKRNLKQMVQGSFQNESRVCDERMEEGEEFRWLELQRNKREPKARLVQIGGRGWSQERKD